jgi:phage major head subunit gpT-like protein
MSTMEPTETNLKLLFVAYSASFNKGLEAAVSHKDKIAMTVQSTSSEELYTMLGDFPEIRKWVGNRQIKEMADHGFTIKNELFESTVRVKRTNIEDDHLGHYSPMFQEVGRATKTHPDEVLFGLLQKGFTTDCYDGQFFFDDSHFMYHNGATGQDELYSNLQTGSSQPWYLFDTTRMLKPMIWQERVPYKLTKLDQDSNENVFLADEYLYGVRGRANAGYGLWQLAFGSKAELTVANYEDARARMMGVRSDTGRRLGVTPNLMIVPPELEKQGRAILKAAQNNSSSNIWQDSAELVVTPYLD